MKTVTKAADIVGLTVRMIQEYEKYGVAIKPTERNKYGYLMYDDDAIDRLWQIRFYRELGYDKKAIKAVFDDPCYDFSTTLETQVKQLEQKRQEIDNLINIANLMKETGLTPKALHSQAAMMGATFNDTFGVLGAVTRQFANDETKPGDCPITDEEFEHMFEAFESVLDLYKNGLAYDEDPVQTAVQAFHELASPLLSNAVSGLMIASFLIAPGSKGAEEIEAEYKLPGAAEFIQQAVNKYIEDNIDKGPDKVLNDALEEIVSFGKQNTSRGRTRYSPLLIKFITFTQNSTTNRSFPRRSLCGNRSNFMPTQATMGSLIRQLTVRVPESMCLQHSGITAKISTRRNKPKLCGIHLSFQIFHCPFCHKGATLGKVRKCLS